MLSIKTQIRLVQILGVLSLISGVFSHLALTDIAHSEPNTTGEWLILRISAVILVAFILSAMIVLKRVSRILNV